jgi:uncharacterized protein (DUF427 family)
MATPMGRPVRRPSIAAFEPETPRLLRALTIEPSLRRVRAFFGGVPVADSRRVMLVFEPQRMPVYWFPRKDVHADLLQPAGHDAKASPAVDRWTLRVGDHVAERAAWSYPKPGPEQAALTDHIAFFWDKLDAWFEEDDEVFVHPRDPYHRVDVLRSSRNVRVEVEGQVVAETRRPCLLFETGLPVRYYLPKLDVRRDLLEPSDKTARSPYKGVAIYWSLRLNGRLFEDVVWSFPQPIPECPKIEDLLCFENERTDIAVDGELQERPVTSWS